MKKNKQSPARRSGIAGPSTAAKEAINHPVQPPSYNLNRATQHRTPDRSRSRNHRSRSPKCAPDEADNHLIELAVAAQADAIVTRNLRDVARGELKFPMLRVLTPEQCLEAFPCPP